MKKETYFDKLYGDVFPDWLRNREANELEPTCAYCNSPDLEQGEQFCCERCENLFYEEMDVWADREEERYLREKEEK